MKREIEKHVRNVLSQYLRLIYTIYLHATYATYKLKSTMQFCIFLFNARKVDNLILNRIPIEMVEKKHENGYSVSVK